MFVPILTVGLFVLLGIVLSMGKGSFLIAGFNTMPKKEKEKYDVVSLCKFMGKFMFVIAFSVALFILSDLTETEVLLHIGLALFSASIVFMLIYTNTGNRFKKQ